MTDDTHSEKIERRSRPAATTEEVVARGRAARTPFVLLGGMAVVIWAVVAIVAIALLLIWWLV